MTRVATSSLQNQILNHVVNNTADYARLQEQITTGKKAQQYSGLGDLAGQQIDLSAQVRAYDQYTENSQTAGSRLDTQATALDTLFDVASDMRTKVMQALSGTTGNQGQVTTLANTAIDTVAAALNSSLGGVYVFGGIGGDQPPVDVSDRSVLAPLDAGEASPEKPLYYNGATEQSQARIDDTETINYGLTANDPAFDKLMRALNLVATSGGEEDKLNEANAMLADAITGIADNQAVVGNQQKQIEDIQSRQSEFKLTLKTQLGTIEDVDPSLAMVELTKVQTVLQASYMALSRVSQLSLLNSIS